MRPFLASSGQTLLLKLRKAYFLSTFIGPHSMKYLVKIASIALIGSLGLAACQKDKKTVEDPAPEPVTPITPVTPKGDMKIEFSNMVDDELLVFGKSYTNPNGEPYTVSKFNYYISNIVLTKSDNSVLKIDNLYHIVNHSKDTSRIVKISGIPEGSYKAMKIMLGVDSVRNRSGAQTGGLDIGYAYENSMYWDWNQGYIFLKLEGVSASSPSNDIAFHMGGGNGPNRTQREFDIYFSGAEAAVSKAATPTVNLIVNVNEMFKSPTTLSFTKHSSILSPGTKDTKMIADNYADMIKFGSIKN